VYLEISAFEGRRVGLSQPSWIILDEFNITLETRTYDFTSTEPKGKFSPTFLATLAETIRATLSRGDVAPVKRN
jgi:hypothetical protein